MLKRRVWWLALAVAAAAFALYRATLLPGFDFGDTPSFQVMAGSPLISPRDSYPLYFAIGRLFAWLTPADPAHAMNLASAVEAALACGLFVVVAFELCGSLIAAAAGAAALAGSYTFWTQAIIAEVYALHMLLVLATLLLLLRWQQQPTAARLAAFFAVYAVSFGNHLSMSMMLPVYAGFLLLAAPGGWRAVLAPRVVVLAAVLAALGALQYLWNLRALWLAAQPPPSLWTALQTFWFDVTKSDWRDTMVMGVPSGMASERLQMYRFDLVQQFGWLIPAVAAVGALHLLSRDRSRALLVMGVYLANLLFALGYNVGDSHVFFLPSHLMVALLASAGIAAIDSWIGLRGAAAIALAALASVRLYDTYPAVDRHGDDRPRAVLDRLTSGLDARNAVLLTDLNWQVQNGLNYYAKFVRPELVATRAPDVLLYAPALVRDNRVIGRDTILSERAKNEFDGAYGPLLPSVVDSTSLPASLSALVAGIAGGTPYVLCVLRPTRDFSLDRSDIEQAVQALTGDSIAVPDDEYVAIVGVTGSPPTLVRSSPRPFRAAATVDGIAVDVRMESWLAFDTIRRMGFGQVVAAHHHTLIVERGVSFATFDPTGRATRTSYQSNIYAAQPRFRVVGP
jgi:hypothetical protein